jgi:sugar phosphate isomerase/epimerase
MKPAICNELFENWSWESICEYCQRIGYAGLEIAPFTLPRLVSGTDRSDDSPVALTIAARDKLRKTCERWGLEIIGLHWLLAKTTGLHLTSEDTGILDSTADYLVQLAELCSDLGGKIMVLGSPQQRSFPSHQSPQSAHNAFARVLSQILPQFERLNVILALEPLGPEETNFMQTAESARQIIHEFQSPHLRLHLDVKAMSTESLPIHQIILESRDELVHFHANDPNRLGPGMGDVDYREIFPALREIGYNGWLSVEVFDFSPGPTTIAEQSLDYMNRLM